PGLASGCPFGGEGSGRMMSPQDTAGCRPKPSQVQTQHHPPAPPGRPQTTRDNAAIMIQGLPTHRVFDQTTKTVSGSWRRPVGAFLFVCVMIPQGVALGLHRAAPSGRKTHTQPIGLG
ncbi:MAG: hypothetical protein AAF958_08035, partial [Planctomycetota bacterium]